MILSCVVLWCLLTTRRKLKASLSPPFSLPSFSSVEGHRKARPEKLAKGVWCRFWRLFLHYRIPLIQWIIDTPFAVFAVVQIWRNGIMKSQEKARTRTRTRTGTTTQEGNSRRRFQTKTQDKDTIKKIEETPNKKTQTDCDRRQNGPGADDCLVFWRQDETSHD